MRTTPRRTSGGAPPRDAHERARPRAGRPGPRGPRRPPSRARRRARGIRTTGDRLARGPLAAAGGKGLFVKEIEEALLAGTIDCAVHSMKDVPVRLARGCVIAAVPPRADPRDVLVGGGALAALRPGTRIGTASLRRRARLLA